jgi:catechol 2,3-dioxygenase-like lactoylglutathione lyase family enzyme
MLAGISEITLVTRDIAALERFYTEAFGLRVLAREDDRVLSAVAPAGVVASATKTGGHADDPVRPVDAGAA